MIIVFARIPIPGKIKTRLHACLTEEECATFQEAMALDVLEKLAGCGRPVTLCYSNEWEHVEGGAKIRDSFLARAQDLWGNNGHLFLCAQEGDGLGERMDNATKAVLARGTASCLLLGSDLPYIMRTDIELAERSLEFADVVLGPSKDGGYWLVGMKSPTPELFEGKSYGGKNVLAEAVAACRAHGKKVALARETDDVDTPYDFEKLCRQVNAGDFRLGPRTVDVVGHIMLTKRRG